MTNEQMEKRIAELRGQRSKLFKIKSANPMEITGRVQKIDLEISRLETRLRGR